MKADVRMQSAPGQEPAWRVHVVDVVNTERHVATATLAAPVAVGGAHEKDPRWQAARVRLVWERDSCGTGIWEVVELVAYGELAGLGAPARRTWVGPNVQGAPPWLLALSCSELAPEDTL